MPLRVYRQVRSLGEVLSEQTICIFVGSPLPGTLWIAEVNIDVSRQREAFVIGKLLAAVPGQRLVQLPR